MITVEKTMRKAENSGATNTGTKKKPIPKWFWGLVILGIGYAGYSYFTKNKNGNNEVSGSGEIPTN